ncbi:MAG: hypothetical protein KU37_09105 [Sulfuricurvum sp. PC08-66]|nr:MAG: hypothetical protein KU37_09105 [Sulfuricurvum sp. PC08-66]
MRTLLFWILTFGTLWAWEQELVVDNTHFALSTTIDDTGYVYNFNRLRFTHNSSHEGFSTQIMVDNDTILAPKLFAATTPSTIYFSNSLRTYTPDIPFETSIKLGDDAYDRLKLYRAQLRYEDTLHALDAGLIRVPFGVGRVWTPTDMFNPLNSLSLESGIRAPVLGAHYTYALSPTAFIEGVVSIQESNTTKYALRLKGNIGIGDIALLGVAEANRTLIGYEAEGELFSTGIEMRSEGGFFTYIPTNTTYFKGILGADYTFESGLSLIGEYLYNQTDSSIKAYTTAIQRQYFRDVIGHANRHYASAMAMYAPTTLLTTMVMVMTHLGDGSGMVVPSISYSLSDESTLNVGGFIAFGEDGSEFGESAMVLFASYAITF